MAAQQDSLSASDHAALADGFRPLEAVNPGLPERLVRYVTEGYDESVLSALASTPNAAVLLGMNLSYAGLPPPSRQTPLPAWDALLQHHAEVPVLVLLRFAKVMSSALGPGNLIFYASGRAVVHQAVSALRSLSPPPWLELMVRLGAKPEYAPGIFPMHQNRLSAEVIERMLQADGHSPEIIYHKTFPTMRYDVDSMQVVSLVGGLAGFGERIAERPELVTDALRDSSAVKRVLAVETLERLAIPIVPFLDDLARLATGPAKTLREATSALIVRAGEAALQPLRQIAESGKPDEKGHALRLIAGLDLPEGKAFLHQRVARKTAPGVLKVLKELASEEAPATTPSPRPLSDVDIFAGVELGQETRAALAAWAKNVAATDLDEAFAWLTQPTPWTGDPRSILARAANGDAEGMKILFQRPELTPLHAVRLLRLSGLLQTMPNALIENKLDPRIPTESLERLFGAYRNTHQPRMGLRELAAAFRASALDDELIAWARLGDTWRPRFEWEDEATWPYFADRLDWLARALETPGSSSALARAYIGTTDRRAAALALLATFPEPPPRFVPRLWELALGSSKVHRPLAQKALEKLPDCPRRLFETLASRDFQARKAAAEWIARLEPDGAAEALRAALGSEKSTPVKAVLAGALEALSGLATAASAGDGPSKEAVGTLRSEAAKGLKKGIPEKLSWFPFDVLPVVRWRLDDTPVERDLLSWVVVSAWKSKSAEPTAILRDQVALLRRDDAQVLGKTVLEAWLAADLRPQTPEELRKRLEPLFQLTGTSSVEELMQKKPEFAHLFEQAKAQPATGRTEDKGILALAAACGPTDVVDRIRSYVNQWYGYRAAQCRALIQVLAWIDHPESVAFLLDVARRFRTATIRQEAEIQVRKLVERKGTTLADLAEQSLPDAGFDAEGKLIIDFGPRKFIARLDDDAELYLEDQSGSEIKALPATGQDGQCRARRGGEEAAHRGEEGAEGRPQTGRRAALRGDVHRAGLDVRRLEAHAPGPPGRGPALLSGDLDDPRGDRTSLDVPSARGRHADGPRRQRNSTRRRRDCEDCSSADAPLQDGRSLGGPHGRFRDRSSPPPVRPARLPSAQGISICHGLAAPPRPAAGCSAADPSRPGPGLRPRRVPAPGRRRSLHQAFPRRQPARRSRSPTSTTRSMRPGLTYRSALPGPARIPDRARASCRWKRYLRCS